MSGSDWAESGEDSHPHPCTRSPTAPTVGWTDMEPPTTKTANHTSWGSSNNERCQDKGVYQALCRCSWGGSVV